MDIATLIGLLLGLICIGLAIALGGSVMAYVDAPSMLIVIGGATAATLTAFPVSQTADGDFQGAVHQAGGRCGAD